jgi:DNA-binding IclR family transcriptional regulator
MSVLTKAAQAIEELGSSPNPTRLSTICEALDLPKSSVHRLLNELVELGLVNKSPDGGYAIGHRLLRWGQYAESQVGLRSLATPILRSLRDATGQTIILAIPSGTMRTVVATELGKTLRPVTVDIGDHAILGVGASGKLLYAYATEEVQRQVARLLADRQERLPTPDDVRAMKESGWAASFGEMEPDLAGLSVPILAGDACVGALVVAGSSSTLTWELMQELIAPLREAAERIAKEAMGVHW